MDKNLITNEQYETLNQFYHKIHQATIQGDEWVETSPEIIDHYNKQGLGKSEYFIFQGIKVTHFGKSERLKKELSRQLGQILYGESEGKLNQITEIKPKAL